MHSKILAPEAGATPAIETSKPGPSASAALVAPVAAAYAVRVADLLISKAYLFTPPSSFPHDPVKQGWYFGFEIGRVARSIAAGQGFGSPFHGWTGPTAWLAPIYPYLLAGVFRVFGIYTPASGVVILALNSLFAAATCIPIFYVCDRLLGRRIALWATWLWAVVPLFFVMPVNWAWETSFSTLLLLLALLLSLQLADSPVWASWFAWGVLWGVIALTNPSLLSLMPFALAWAFFRSADRGRGSRGVAAALLACFLTIAPWLVRNHRTFGQWIFIRDNFGAELSFGNAEPARGIWLGWTHPSINDVELERYRKQGELAYINHRKHRALEFIRHRPAFFLELTVRRFFLFWAGVPSTMGEDLGARDILVEQWPAICFAAFAFAGLVQMVRRRHRAAWFLAPALLVYPALYYVTYPHPRYRHPIEPVMLMLAVYAVAETKELRSYFAAQ